MWGIGIRSSIITILSLMAYTLLVQVLALKDTLWGNLEYVVFMMGIYSTHYYYKTTHHKQMSYSQGLKLGLINVFFTALLISCITYGLILQYGNDLTTLLLKNMQATLQQANTKDSGLPDPSLWLTQLYKPYWLVVAIFFSIFLTGFLLTLFITLFSRTKKLSVN